MWIMDRANSETDDVTFCYFDRDPNAPCFFLGHPPCRHLLTLEYCMTSPFPCLPKHKREVKMSLRSQFVHLQSFAIAQCRMAVVVLIAKTCNEWESSFSREKNASPVLFWSACCFLGTLVIADKVFWSKRQAKSALPATDDKAASEYPGGAPAGTKETPPSQSPRSASIPQLQLHLSRAECEEWKGWMQYVFVFYHYYRARFLYNPIRVMVSSYVWLSGYGNYLALAETKTGTKTSGRSSTTCDKRDRFSAVKVFSALIRLNWFALWLVAVIPGTSLELYYVVPLHTVAYLVTYLFCWMRVQVLQSWRIDDGTGTGTKVKPVPDWLVDVVLLGLFFLFHVLFFETAVAERILSKELNFRFQADRYSALQGVLAAVVVTHVGKRGRIENISTDTCSTVPSYGCSFATTTTVLSRVLSSNSLAAGFGLALATLWYCIWGWNPDKFTYNPSHPLIFSLPLIAYCVLRRVLWPIKNEQSASKILRSLGAHSLEIYLLQFHVFMCRNVQHVLVLVFPEQIIFPGGEASGGPSIPGPLPAAVFNTLLVGSLFAVLVYQARLATVETQQSLQAMLVASLRKGRREVAVDKEENENLKNRDTAATSSNEKASISESDTSTKRKEQ
ncbi:unnamed protein product [Amoebophrya sp. A120]|nr:unnamed protein product [Amoebophrya sp. A120]|eukprot:GSA120T00012100001.1